MKTVQILEPDDVIKPTDFCRPLTLETMNGGCSDAYSFRSQYSGTPENNIKWAPVYYCFGSCWNGRLVKEVLHRLPPYEFLRGSPPSEHLLDLSSFDPIQSLGKILQRSP